MFCMFLAANINNCALSQISAEVPQLSHVSGDVANNCSKSWNTVRGLTPLRLHFRKEKEESLNNRNTGEKAGCSFSLGD